MADGVLRARRHPVEAEAPEASVIGHWWHSYWAWAGSNIGAMPAEAIIGGACTLVVSPLLLRAWRRIKRALEAAEASHRIAADLYEHHTGRRHPAAPPDRDDE